MRDIRVSEIDDKPEVVFGHVGAEQQRPMAVHGQVQMRHVPRVGVEEAFRDRVARLRVPIRINDEKRVPMFEDARPVLRRGVGGRNCEWAGPFAFIHPAPLPWS